MARNLREVLDAVAKGERITVLRSGTPVARILPVGQDAGKNQEMDREAFEEMRRIAKANPLHGLGARELIDEGRRY
ncbi:MAG: type II toxin-antitoxin system prevent-host-death family antitoxin [Candidatus Hydrogenedentes bacterium]|nr:type II toxin-antitoxin system prevent-host-death family antitoxin [Candidatus Hydrogenedentota bacterium]